MHRSALEIISDFAVAAGVVGAIAYIYFSFKGGGFKPLRGADAAITNVLAAVAVFLWVGSRFLLWWPPVFFHLAIGTYMSFMGFVGYRNFKGRQ
jgi:hypothetical protein